MCGNSGRERRVIPKKETEYLDALVRGVYAKRDIPKGYEVDHNNFNKDFHLAVPLLKGQLSTRELLNGLPIVKDIAKGAPVRIEDIGGPYSENKDFIDQIRNRGY